MRSRRSRQMLMSGLVTLLHTLERTGAMLSFLVLTTMMPRTQVRHGCSVSSMATRASSTMVAYGSKSHSGSLPTRSSTSSTIPAPTKATPVQVESFHRGGCCAALPSRATWRKLLPLHAVRTPQNLLALVGSAHLKQTMSVA